MQKIKDMTWVGLMLAHLFLFVVVGFIGVRVYRSTVPKLNSEIDESHRASVEVGLTAKEARQLVLQEKKSLPETQAKINTLLDTADKVLASAQKQLDEAGKNQDRISDATVESIKKLGDSAAAIKPVLEETQKTVSSVQPVTQQLQGAASALTDMAKAGTDDLNNQDAKDTMTNLKKASRSFADMADDTKKWWHSWLHPSWAKRIEGDLENWGVTVGKVFIP